MAVIAFINVFQRGHINPTLPVVKKLVERGHRVIYYAFDYSKQEIEATGAEYRPTPILAQYQKTIRSPIDFISRLATTAYDLIRPISKELLLDNVDGIVYDSCCPWGRGVARATGVAAISSFTTFAFNKHVPSPDSIKYLWQARNFSIASLVDLSRYGLARYRLHESYGTPLTPFFGILGLSEDTNIVYTSRYFQPKHDTFNSGYHFVGSSLGARSSNTAFPVEKLRNKKVVYFSLGTSFNAQPEILHSAINAFRGTDWTLVLSTGDVNPEILGELPPNIIAERYVPQLEVLEYANVMVSHGGMNSVNEALWHNVPLVLCPMNADQPIVSKRVSDLGAGIILPVENLSSPSIRSFVETVYNTTSMKMAAEKIGSDLRNAGGASLAAEIIERKFAK
uniref:macrolide family glycosyltransferase n=1 Tax=Thaumasiovibrio occultus TaxID=1891184 RepID=UPI000B3632E0|nr:macrolide family glycosyltransferase [Thaumasiovibrio occultus]